MEMSKKQMVVLLAVFLVTMQTTARAASGEFPSCVSALQPCIQYLSVSEPSSECCSALDKVVEEEPDCFCKEIENPSNPQFSLHKARVLGLPERCGNNFSMENCTQEEPAKDPSISSPTGPDGSGALTVMVATQLWGLIIGWFFVGGCIFA